MEKIFQSLLPEPMSRRRCLEVLADYIIYADKMGKSLWVTTLKNEHLVFAPPDTNRRVKLENQQRPLTLNVGRIPVYGIYCAGIYPDGIYRSSALRFVFNPDVLHPEEINQLKQKQFFNGAYDFANGMIDTVIEPSQIEEILPLIKKFYQASIEKAAENISRTPYYNSHAPDVISYLRQILNRNIPDPVYQTI